MRVLTWNLFHGRAVPPAGRDLQGEFAAALRGWAWDVALLQEVPPWFPPHLGGDEQRTVLTDRNELLCARRWLARRWPDVLKSEGGGANAILVRRPHRIAEHRVLRLQEHPERRMLHAVRLARGWWVANMHLSNGNAPQAAAELERTRATVLAWAGPHAPVILGGDINLRRWHVRGLARLAARDVDALFARGARATTAAEHLDRGSLSDHVPLAVEVAAP